MLNCVIANKSTNLALIGAGNDLTPDTISTLVNLTNDLFAIKETISYQGYSTPQVLYINSFINHLNLKIDLFKSGWNNMQVETFVHTSVVCCTLCLENIYIIAEKKIIINSNLSFFYNNDYITNINSGFCQPSYVTKYLQSSVHNPHDYEVLMKYPQPPIPGNELLILTAIALAGTISYYYLG